jgi:molybdopterin-guanine dinucleotide biosynthesis protein A
MSRDPILALVLAGGGGRRLGGVDKAFLDLADRPLIAHVLAALTPLPTAISANGDPARFTAFGRPVLPDGVFAGRGPLAGLLAGLDWAAERGAETLLTVPCDTPLIPRDLARTLWPAPSRACSRGKPHHLVALWPVAARDALRDWLFGPNPGIVGRFAHTLGVREVDFPARTWDPFLNINTPADLARIRALIQGDNQRGAR